MLEKVSKAIGSPAVFLAGGLATTLMAAFLAWSDITAPLSARLPVPSPDGGSFAYFDSLRSSSLGRQTGFDLVASAADGRMLGRFSIKPGIILWSNAGNLGVVNREQSSVTVISRIGAGYLILDRLPLLKDSEPIWSPSGTQLAYLPPKSSDGGIEIYDLEQTRTMPVPLPPEFHAGDATLLFWSPSAEELYFLEAERDEVDLESVQVSSHQVRRLATGSRAWLTPGGIPLVSPNGALIFLPYPAREVIDTKTGKTSWAFTGDVVPLASPWSTGSREFYYLRQSQPSVIFSHNFENSSDRRVLSNTPAGGFFSADGQSYFFRAVARPSSSGPWFWNAPGDGWRRVDVQTQIVQPLGRVELQPWAETHEGKILAISRDYLNVQMGLYDPASAAFSEYEFPTSIDDLFCQAESRAVALFTLLLYGFLGFFVYLKRPRTSPARALSALCFLLMTIFALDGSHDVMPIQRQLSPFPASLTAAWRGQSWQPEPLGLSGMPGEAVLSFVFLFLLALTPAAFLHFAFLFPDGNRFLAGRKKIKAILYAAALCPVLAVAWTSLRPSGPSAFQMTPAVLIMAAGAIALVTAVQALRHSYQYPLDRRVKNQIRWAGLALALPIAGMSGLWGLNLAVATFPRRFPVGLNAASLGTLLLPGPFCLAYALFACKPFDTKVLLRRAARYILMMILAAIVYSALAGGLALAGSMESRPVFVLVAPTILTVLVLVAAWRRLELAIERTIDRKNYDFRQALLRFASGLPQILDRRTIQSRLSETIKNAMKCHRFYLFVPDARTGKLRPQLPAGQAEAAGLEFDPSDPLCRYLLEKSPSLEVEVAPFDSRLARIVSGEADRLSKLEAAVVFGIARRGELVGLMTVGSKENDEFYNSEELKLLEVVASQAAIAIEHTEMFEEVSPNREIKKGTEPPSEVPSHLFPAAIQNLAGCQIAGKCVPARVASGDYYDFFELPGKRIGLAIGDGKELSALLVEAKLQGLLRQPASEKVDLSEAVRRINRQLYGSFRGAKNCSFFFGVFDGEHFQVDFVNAGHKPPLVLLADKTIFLESTGMPLGLFPDSTHEVRHEVLGPGAQVLLYSNGVTESKNLVGETFGVDRLVKSILGTGGLEAAEAVERILNDVHNFSGNSPIESGRVVVLLRMKVK